VTALRPEYCSFYNCSFDNTTNGVYVDNSLAFNFTNCFFSNRPNNGCVIGTTNSESIIFENCIFFNNDKNGLVVLANSKHTVVNNCRFVANSVTSANTYHGLAIASNTNYFTITNNLFKNGWDGTGSQGYGLVINAGTSNYFQVSNNTFLSNGIGSISLSVSGTIVYVKDNVGFLTRNAGTATITLGLSSVVVTHGLGGQPYSKDIIIIASLIPTVAVYVSALTPTTFTISAVAPVAADVVLNWNATIFNG
jgi:hypothetical protein